MTSYKGYICLQHDDLGQTAYTEAFKKYTHNFSVSCVPAFVSYFGRFSFRDKIGGTTYYWPSLTAGEMREMYASGRVSFQNHSLAHMNLSKLPATEDAEALRHLELACLSAETWIRDFTGTKPTMFTPPYLQFHAWQATYFDSWFRYWFVDTLGTGDTDWTNYANFLNSFPLPTRLEGLYLGGISGGADAVSATVWAGVDALLTHLETNKKVAIIMMHDIRTSPVSGLGRNILPEDYKTLMNKLAAIQADGKLLKESELI